jgi:hypothetical protein
MSIIRHAQTNEQEEALGLLSQWAKNANFRIRYGTSVGKAPQTLIIDHNFQDGLIYINSDGEIKINDVVIETEEDFIEAVLPGQVK